DDGMIDEYLVEIVGVRETIEIIKRAKAQVVELWQVVMQAGDDIETGEIKLREFVVEEELLHNPDLAVERARNARLIHQSHTWSHQNIILFTPADERGIGCPVERRVNRDRKRFILFRPLQDLLLADVFVVGTCDCQTFSLGARGDSRAWIRLPAQQL